MIYHLLPGDSDLITIDIIRYFISFSKNINTSPNDHFFILYSDSEKTKERYVNLCCKDEQVKFIDESKTELRNVFRSLTKSDCMILHGGFHPQFWKVLIWYPSLWKKTAWIIWGGDLYLEGNYYHAKSFLKKIKRMLRRRLVHNLGMISVLVPDDYEIFQKYYGSCENWVNATYCTLSLSTKSFVNVKTYKEDYQKDAIKILLGNSAARSNNHEEMLFLLKKFSDRNIQVICPLGYPENQDYQDYKEKICKIGREIYGQKFSPILSKLAKPEYVDILNSIDILVFNHNRQQGLFNLNYFLFQGKKAYVNGQCSTYKSYLNYGIEVYDTRTIKDLKYDEFVTMANDRRKKNIELMQKYWSIEASFHNWCRLIPTIRKNH